MNRAYLQMEILIIRSKISRLEMVSLIEKIDNTMWAEQSRSARARIDQVPKLN